MEVKAASLQANGSRMGALAAITGFFGLLAPLPLYLDSIFPSFLWKLVSLASFGFYNFFEYLLSEWEELSNTKGPFYRKWPLPFSTLAYFWFGFFVFEWAYWTTGTAVIRYVNLGCLLMLAISLTLIFYYLKRLQQPIRIRNFTKILSELGAENEADAPYNYLTLTFLVLKKDLLASLLILAGLWNMYILYGFLAFGTLGIFGFTLYSLIALALMGNKKNSAV